MKRNGIQSFLPVLLLLCSGCLHSRTSSPDSLAPYRYPQVDTVYVQVLDSRPDWERTAPRGEDLPVQTQDGVNPDRVRVVFLQEVGEFFQRQNIAGRVLSLFPDQEVPEAAIVFRLKLISWVGIGKPPPHDDAVEGRCHFSVERFDGAGWTFIGLFEGLAFTEVEGEDVEVSLLNLLTVKAAGAALEEFWVQYKELYPSE